MGFVATNLERLFYSQTDDCANGPCSHCLEFNDMVARVHLFEDLVNQYETEKNGAYAERNRLVAALSKLFPSSLERHPKNETWDEDWRWIVFIDLPTGQVSWHIHDSEISQFDHLRRFQCRVWDGHTTDEKYVRLAGLKSSLGERLASLKAALSTAILWLFTESPDFNKESLKWLQSMVDAE